MISYAKKVNQATRACSREVFEGIVADKDGELMRICKHVQLCKEKAERHIAQAAQYEQEGKEELAAQEREAAHRLHEDASQQKKRLPVFCFLGTYTFGRRTERNVQANGLVYMDFDHAIDADAKSLNRMQQISRVTDQLSQLVKEEGVVLCHITCSGTGWRFVFKGNPLLSYEANQEHFAEVSGLKQYWDGACRDLARTSFAVPKDYILYVSEELFTYERPLPLAAMSGAVKAVAAADGLGRQGATAGSPSGSEGEGASVAAAGDWERDDAGELTYKGVTYKRIIEEWWKLQGGEPVQGERNTQLQRLATNLRYICDNRLDILREVVPCYGLSEAEMGQLLQSSIHYPLMNYLPRQLRKVLDGLHIPRVRLSGEERSGGSVQPREVCDGEYMTQEEMGYWNDRLSDIALPVGLSHSVASVSKENAMNVLVAVLPVAYTCATGISYKIWDNQWYRLSGTAVIIGNAASGKSFCKSILKAWLSPINAVDAMSRAVENQYKKEREAAGQTKMKSQRPQVVVRQVPAKASLSTLLERNNNARRQVWNVPHTQQYWQHTHLITVEFEFSTIVKSLKQSFSDYMDFLVKAHQDEEIGVDYRNDASANGIRNIHWNQVFAGNMVDFRRLFNRSNVLNGMPLRIMPIFVPDNSFEMNAQSSRMSAFLRSNILAAATRLDQLTGNIDAQPMSERMYRHSEQLALWAKEHGDKVADFIRRRACSTIGMRAGILSALLRNADHWDELPVRVLNEQEGLQESDEEWARVVEFCEDDFLLAELVADYVFDQQYKLFKKDMEELMMEQQLPVRGIVCGNYREKTLALFEQLPQEFDREDVVRVFGVLTHTANNYCLKWVKDGLVKNVSKTKYSKC